MSSPVSLSPSCCHGSSYWTNQKFKKGASKKEFSCCGSSYTNHSRFLKEESWPALFQWAPGAPVSNTVHVVSSTPDVPGLSQPPLLLWTPTWLFSRGRRFMRLTLVHFVLQGSLPPHLHSLPLLRGAAICPGVWSFHLSFIIPLQRVYDYVHLVSCYLTESIDHQKVKRSKSNQQIMGGKWGASFLHLYYHGRLLDVTYHTHA